MSETERSPAGGTVGERPPSPARVRLGAWAAEAVGTFFFVWLGTATVLATAQLLTPDAALNSAAISLAFGFAVLVAVYAVGHLSGAHINPAVTIGLAVVRSFPWRAVPGYLAAQSVGALLAALSNWAIFGLDGRAAELALGATTPGDRGAPAALLAEFLITFLLMVTIMATVLDDRSPGPLAPGLAVGLMVAAGIFATLPVSGGSFNPARTLAPMLVSMQFDGWWVYVIGPVSGAVVGALFYRHVLRPAAAPE
ncbi:MIP/aquaporin family protein [Pseudonocardia sp.]|uniref:MIP/aquaporin family protein n=1 Tax=Pseudonocardia sp. TaxID=60912 RepID=UPI00262A6909|nr:MIP/aquaporin family protein [Pseudonocardia sp.]